MSATRSPGKKSKSYPIHQSPLFRMRGKGQLCAALGVEVRELDDTPTSDSYRVWINERGREIQQPVGRIARIHDKLGQLLAKVVVPDYVMSRRGCSYLDNARQHWGDAPLGKTDITKFYPSTTRRMVRDMFIREFQCARDIASTLAGLCCYNGTHLPTGSAISGRVAYLAAKPMFDEIYELACRTESRMTLYVDDITLSGFAVSKRLLAEVSKIVRRHGLRTHRKKTKTFAAAAVKPVTGAMVVGYELRLPNIRHQKIWEARSALRHAEGLEKEELLCSLAGRLQEAKQLTETNLSKVLAAKTP